MAKFILVYTHPTEGEQRFELVSGRSYRIGSRPDNDIVIDQKDVSRRHAVLRVHDGTFHITDLDSKNGTFINGAKTVAETFNCGDMVHLSSARLVIVEVGTGSYPTSTEAIALQDEESGVRASEDTQKYRSEASMEDVVSLLETTASAVRRGALADPLRWAVEHLGFDGALVLYRDENDNVGMVSSAGDLGQLARKSSVLARLATEKRNTGGAGTRVRQVTEFGERLLIATVGADHILVVRYAGRPPAIGDLRSVIAAVSAVLASGRVIGQGAVTGAFRTGPDGRATVDPLARIAGLSNAMVTCKLELVEAAQRNRPVVLVGERGAGCSAVGRAVHDLSARAAAPYVVIDLEGVKAETLTHRLLVVGEAATSADDAEAGTLVLDRVGDLRVETWNAVVEAVADRGADAPRLTLIFNPDPADGGSAASSAGFEGIHVAVPSLRQRREDVPILVNHFALDHGGFGHSRPVSFSRAALEALSSYGWPGNVVELRNEVGRAVASAHPDHVVDIGHLSERLRTDGAAGRVTDLDLEALADNELAEARNLFEAWLIRRALAATDGTQTAAAQRLGLSRAGLFKKMRKLGI